MFIHDARQNFSNLAAAFSLIKDRQREKKSDINRPDCRFTAINFNLTRTIL